MPIVKDVSVAHNSDFAQALNPRENRSERKGRHSGMPLFGMRAKSSKG
jgi:hypothetical protein